MTEEGEALLGDEAADHPDDHLRADPVLHPGPDSLLLRGRRLDLPCGRPVRVHSPHPGPGPAPGPAGAVQALRAAELGEQVVVPQEVVLDPPALPPARALGEGLG